MIASLQLLLVGDPGLFQQVNLHVRTRQLASLVEVNPDKFSLQTECFSIFYKAVHQTEMYREYQSAILKGVVFFPSKQTKAYVKNIKYAQMHIK